MNIKKAFNSFLQLIYKLFSALIGVGAVLLIVLTVLTISLNINYDRHLFFVLGGGSLVALYYIWKNRSRISESKNKNSSWHLFFEIARLTIGSIFFLVIVIGIGGQKLKQESGIVDEAESVILYTDSIGTNVSKYYLSQQTWTDFNRKKHKLPFKVDYHNVIKSKQNREDFKLYYRGDHILFWNKVYRNMADHDRPLVNELAQTFFEYQKDKKMSRRDFAELMITAIQDIPYTLVLQVACKASDIKPCVGDTKRGLFAPAEFVSNLTGDCDTRTVLLFTLLSKFNYDVAILNSIEYEHSVLGLQILSTGKFKMHNRKKYYFIETTSKRNPIGHLHPDYSNIAFWDVVLTNN